ncbi:MAG TPA: hypothetical protein VIK61_15320 [Acidimicrobiia bacterium]
MAWSWATTALFAVSALAVTFGASSLEGVTIVISLALFAASLGVWAYSFGLAVVRSSRGDEISVPTLFFLSSGSAPTPVRRQLMGSLAASVVIAVATVKANPFSALVPMLALGLAGLWAARHGTFPPRRPAARPGAPRASGPRPPVRSSSPRRSDGRPGQ